MGYTEGVWRVKAIFLIVIVMSSMYMAEAVFLIDPPTTAYSEEALNWTGTNTSWGTNVSSTSQQEVGNIGTDIFGVIGFIFGFVTFSASPDIPPALSWILSIFMLCLVIILAYIVYTFAYEIVKGLPFT